MSQKIIMPDELIQSERNAVLKTFSKTDDDIKNDTDYLLDWMQQQSHFPVVPETKMYRNRLEIVLLHSKFSLERAKRVIDTHLTIKSLIPELFQNWDVNSPEIQLVLKTCAWLPLRKLTPNLECVSLIRFLNNDPNNFNPWEAVKIVLILGFLRSEVESNIGEHIIFDLKGFSMAHMLKFTPTIVNKAVVSIKNACGRRIRGIHFLNTPSQFDMILSMMKIFLPPKVFGRTLESLYKSVPKNVLPKDYGGDEPLYEESLDKWKRLLELNRERILEDCKLRTIETKRVNGTVKEDMFGSMHGSFRQLNLD